MSTIKQQCVCAFGPYKDYYGRAEYDNETQVFHGDVTGTRDVITFQGRTIEELSEAFIASIDDYLKFCKEIEQVPEKPFSGKFVARLPPELHKKISGMAEVAGKSLNQLVVEFLETMVGNVSNPTRNSIPRGIKITEKARASKGKRSVNSRERQVKQPAKPRRRNEKQHV